MNEPVTYGVDFGRPYNYGLMLKYYQEVNYMFKDKQYYIEKTKQLVGMFASALAFVAILFFIILW